MKCLPAQKIPSSKGRLLHDSHAEILAIRGFNNFLLRECAKLAADPLASSAYLLRKDWPCSADLEGRPFTLNPLLKLHLYASEAPCGDASMELTMRGQEDATPWPVAVPKPTDEQMSLKGRGYFSELGVVRRKPARGDSPESLSKSCSDKLALKQFTSLLSSLAALLVEPGNAYLASVVVPESQYVAGGFERSFGASGRLKDAADTAFEHGSTFKPFEIRTTEFEFQYSRRSLESQGPSAKSSNICAVWNPHTQETVINGALQGWKQDNPRCASSIARIRMAQTALELMKQVDPERYQDCLDAGTYRSLKDVDLLASRKGVKQAVLSSSLERWVPNVEDSFDFDRT